MYFFFLMMLGELASLLFCSQFFQHQDLLYFAHNLHLVEISHQELKLESPSFAEGQMSFPHQGHLFECTKLHLSIGQNILQNI